MKILGCDYKSDLFTCQISKDELSVLLGRTVYQNEIEGIVGKEFTGVIKMFQENKSAINDLNYNANDIERKLIEMVEKIKSIKFVIPERVQEVKL